MVVFDSFESFMDFVHLQREPRLHTRTTVSSQCCLRRLVVQRFAVTTSVSDSLNGEL